MAYVAATVARAVDLQRVLALVDEVERAETVARPLLNGRALDTDLVKALGLNGGMPTRVSVGAKKLDEVIAVLSDFGRAS